MGEQFGINGDRSFKSFEKLFRANEGNYVKVCTKVNDPEVLKGYILSATDDALLLSTDNGISRIDYGDIFYLLFDVVVLPFDENGEWK